jgi:hypothetical protein
MKKPTAPKTAFRISSETSNRFKHLSFQILKRKEYSVTDMEEIAVIRFQSDATNKGWYGVRTTIEARGNPIAHVSDALKLLKKIMPESQYEEQTPEKILAKFSELRIERVEYDSRLSQFVTEKDCPDVELTRWMDGYRNYNNDYGCSVAVLANNEQSAREKLTREFADNVSKGGSSATFEKWIAAGKPVEENRGPYSNAARFSPMESLVEPLA